MLFNLHPSVWSPETLGLRLGTKAEFMDHNGVLVYLKGLADCVELDEVLT